MQSLHIQPTALRVLDTVCDNEFSLLVRLELQLPFNDTCGLVKLSAAEFLGGNGDIRIL